MDHARAPLLRGWSYPRNSIRYIRYAVQLGFLLVTLLAGWQFYQFVLHFEAPGNPFVQRPPSVDAYLPIGGLMAFKYFAVTGIVEPLHPSGLMLFIAILGVSLLLKKGFCGWICPIGTVSQYAWMLGEKAFGRNFRVERYTDIGLRSIKYVLLSLFFWVIAVAMGSTMILMFFLSDYYQVADVKMLKFFTDMSRLSMAVLTVLTVLSVVYKNFWCRYLALMPREGVEPSMAWGHVRAIMGSFQPKHEHKEAACRFLLDEWFTGAHWE